MSVYRSWDELSPLEQLQSQYSDLHKDVHGGRPYGGNFMRLTLEELQAEYDSLLAYGEIVWAREEEYQRECIQRCETAIQNIIASGAKNRETAIRWLLDAEDCNGDSEYLCYKLGIPYGYFKKAA